ncbi:hypothetical protein QTG54_010942 [Skeletonema marinoi]|uniref:Prolyl 4-hydroxylase alpha subunit Fe(2+) 2OG dioxygenase domain-containing protein n=1 Tax=Skeletonema marinoi TaxID=267567 RepID=A0AAD8Y315_9STRA|nr:hypothetical protein QTG54_010942 [Skeletonema marinoi]
MKKEMQHSLVTTTLLLVYACTLSCGFTHFSLPILCRRDVPFTSHVKSITTTSSRRKHPIYQTDQSQEIEEPCIRLEASSFFGVDNDELTHLLEAISGVCDEYGVQFDHTMSTSNIFLSSQPSTSVPGALGRVVMIDVHGAADMNFDESDFITELKNGMSQQIDGYLYSGQLSQPVLLAFQCAAAKSATLDDIIEQEVRDYGLRDGVTRDTQANHDDASFIPSRHIKVDGAMIQTIESPGQSHFDTSSVIIFDNIVDDSLRRRLLNVVKGYPEDATGDIFWDDVKDGPNPDRWARGGLMDVVDSKSDEEEDGPCWGLTDDAVMDICFNDHSAVKEFEAKLGQLFEDFIVTTLPEAVLGDCVSPITANAPCHGDRFDFHIDADPMQVPPSPWADVFGRYPNRSKEKPRFVSVLLYLNDDWAEEWGAPTKFLDPPTQECYEVFPQPGRCVIMDQDISHTVVAPRKEAGKSPRYSMVWKLILHPKKAGQDMTDLSCGREKLWPEPELLGSAIQQEL